MCSKTQVFYKLEYLPLLIWICPCQNFQGKPFTSSYNIAHMDNTIELYFWYFFMLPNEMILCRSLYFIYCDVIDSSILRKNMVVILVSAGIFLCWSYVGSFSNKHVPSACLFTLPTQLCPSISFVHTFQLSYYLPQYTLSESDYLE